MSTTTWMTFPVALALVLCAQGLLLWHLKKMADTFARRDEKLAHFGDALALLTETTESGFRAVAAEIDRTSPKSAAAVKKSLAPSSGARISAAARRGRSVSEIAAAEELSEGEVRLRLHLSKQAAQAGAPGARTVRAGVEAGVPGARTWRAGVERPRLGGRARRGTGVPDGHRRRW